MRDGGEGFAWRLARERGAAYLSSSGRGIDILQWNGDTYVPNAQGRVVHQKGKVRGTSADPPKAALKAALVGEDQLLAQLHSVGWFPGYCQLQAARYGHA